MKKILTREEALLAMADLCARSEQCAYDIAKKLRLKGLSSSDIMAVILELEEREFIDHKRFARSFARDKVRFSAWGKNKIKAALLSKRISASIINEAFQHIEPEDYNDALTRAAKAKSRQLDLSQYEDRLKLYRHLVSRGFESSIVSKIVKTLQNS